MDPFAPTQRAPAPAPEKAPCPFGAAPPAFGASEKKKEKKKRSRSRSRGRRRGRDDRRRQHRENDASKLRQAERFVSPYRLDPMAGAHAGPVEAGSKMCVARRALLMVEMYRAIDVAYWKATRYENVKTGLSRTPSPSRSRGRRSRSSSSSSRKFLVLSVESVAEPVEGQKSPRRRAPRMTRRRTTRRSARGSRSRSRGRRRRKSPSRRVHPRAESSGARRRRKRRKKKEEAKKKKGSMWGQGALHRRADGDARGPAAGHDGPLRRPRRCRSRSRTRCRRSTRCRPCGRIGCWTCTSGTSSLVPVSSRSRSGFEGLVTAVRESLPPESPGRILLAESPDGQFESYIRSGKVAAPEGEVSPKDENGPRVHRVPRCRRGGSTSSL